MVSTVSAQCSIACAIDLHIVEAAAGLELLANARGSDVQLASETGQPIVSVAHASCPDRNWAHVVMSRHAVS
jgi:hypothetical protein